MSRIPGNIAVSHNARVVRLSEHGTALDTSAVIDSSNTDAGSTPTTRMRPGNVLVKRTSTGRYIEANDSNGDRNAPASVSASETADTDWQNAVITVTVDGGVSFSVTLGAADDTDAEVVAALNGNAVFAANCKADVSGGVVRIRTLEAGAHKHLTVSADLATAFGSAGTSGNGTDADYVVQLPYVDLEDENGTATHAEARVARVGHFDESQLINLTAEARATLSRRGSFFG